MPKNHWAYKTPHRPLGLKRVLLRLRIPQATFGAAIRQQDGHSFARSTIGQLINRGYWPANTPRELIMRQATQFLQGRGATEDDLRTAFEVDDAAGGLMAMQAHPRTPAGTDPEVDTTQLPEAEMLSHEAQKHFKLFKNPFQDDVQGPEDVFLSHEQRYIREAMYTTARHGGFMAVVGESGAGKTVLRRDLIDRVHRDGLPITIIQPRIVDKGRLTAGAICDAIIQDVSQQTPRQSLEAKARQIEQLLTGSSRAGHSHVLIIEEAHDLSVPTLKYLKRFWELEDGFRKLLGILLIGQPELKAKLDERQNWEAREVIRRCEIAELAPLNGSLEEYLATKFSRVGAPLDQVFGADAFDAIRERLTLRRRGTEQTVSMHYPLVVNNLCVRALNLAARVGAERISAEVIRMALETRGV